MELFLNLLWLSLSATALVWWCVRNRDHNGAELRREGVALLFVLVLMFFVISMTDDLHQEIILAEDCCFVRRQTACIATPNHLVSPALAAHHPAIVLCFVRTFGDAESSTPLYTAARALPAMRAHEVVSGRSPPFVL